MFKLSILSPASILLLLMSASLSAQTAQPTSSTTPALSRQVIASVSDNSIRFISLGELIQIRLEVISPSGEVLFDSNFKSANLIDWPVSDKQGRPVADGSYLCVVTVRHQSGQLTRKQAIATFRDRAFGLKQADNSLLTAAQVQAADPPSVEDLSMTIIGLGESPATTVLAHDGATAHLVSGSGGLSISSGDFFANKLVEHIRLTAEGNVGIGVANPQAKLDVAGLIKASQGVIFPDGTVQYSASSKTLGAKSSRSSQKPGQPGSGDDFETQSITQNRIVKFTDNAGTLGDSIILETSGRLGIGTNTPDSLINVQGVIPSQLGHLGVIRATGSFNGFGLLMDATGTGNNALGLAVGGAAKAAFSWDNSRNFFGMANFVFSANDFSLRLNADGSLTFNDGSTSAERFRVTPAGNVGIGTSSPAARLDVAGDINTSTQFNIGGSRVLSVPGTRNTFGGVQAGAINTGINGSFFGASAGKVNSTGNNNSFFGALTGQNNSTGSQNSFLGVGAGFANTTADNNSFFGFNAGAANTIGNSNSFFGEAAGTANTSGGSNSFFGFQAGKATTTAGDNSFFGALAGTANVGASNSFFGAAAGDSNTNGSNNSFFGRNTGATNTTGDFNTFVGVGAGQSNTTGTTNSFFGIFAGNGAIGSNNSFFGANAGLSNFAENDNSFFGALTKGAPNLSNATAIGFRAQVSQSNSMVLGSINNVNGATADTKVGIGTSTPLTTLHVAANGGRILMGNAGCTLGFTGIGFATTLTDCNNYSLLGDGNDTMINAPNLGSLFFRINNVNMMEIGPGGATTLLGDLSSFAGSETSLCLSNGASHLQLCGSSSIRYKTNVTPFSSGLSIVKRLRPVYYNWKADKTPDFGLIAEEVADVEPFLVTHNKDGQIQGVRYERVGVVLITAVKEQQQQIEQQQILIKQQQKQARQQEARLAQQQAEIDSLKLVVCASHSRAAICKRRQLSGKL